MAIAFDSTGGVDGGTSYSHTITGSNVILWVSATYNTVEGTLTGMTCNGVSMVEQARQALPVGTTEVVQFYLVAATSGTVARVGTCSTPTIAGTSYTGVVQSNTIDKTAQRTDTASTTTDLTLTNVTVNTWGFVTIRSSAGGIANNGGSFATMRTFENAWDSGGALTAGDKHAKYVTSIANWAIIATTFLPAAGGATTGNNLILLGVGT